MVSLVRRQERGDTDESTFVRYLETHAGAFVRECRAPGAARDDFFFSNSGSNRDYFKRLHERQPEGGRMQREVKFIE